jgi:hypothetical protein
MDALADPGARRVLRRPARVALLAAQALAGES